MSQDSLSDKDTAQSAIDSIANFANSIIAGGSTHSNSLSESASSRDYSRQVDAIHLIDSIAKNADQKINNLAHVGAKYKSVTQVAVKKYFLHTKSLIRSAVSNFTIKRIIASYRNDLNRILNIIRIDNLYSLIVIKLKASDLSDSNRELATSEIMNVVKQTKANIGHAVSGRMINDSFVSGINAVNGSLSKYVNNNKNSIVRNFSKIITEARNKVNSQKNLSLSAKFLANQGINQIYIRIRRDLRSVDNITAVSKIKKRGIASINRLLTDQNDLLGQLTNFDSFTEQARDQISNLMLLDSNSKRKVNQFIDHVQNWADSSVSYSRDSTVDLDNQERKIAKVVLNQFVRDVYLQLNNSDAYVKKDSTDLISRIKINALQVYQKISRSSGGSIEIELSRGIQSLKLILAQNNYSIYTNFLKRLTRDTRQQIKQMANISLRDRSRIESQIKSIVKTAKDSSDFSSDKFNLINAQKMVRSVAVKFRQLVNHGYFKDALISIGRVNKERQRQIKSSNLSPLQKQQMIRIISNDSTDARLKIINSYKHHKDVSLALNAGINRINHSVKNSLIDDKNNNFDRIHRVIRQAYDRINRIDNLDLEIKRQFNSALNQVALDSSHRINGANDLSKADRIEQVDENRIYYQMGRITSYFDHAESSVINLIFRLSRRANHQISFSNLSLSQKRAFSNQIDRHANLSVRKVMATRRNSQRQPWRRMIVSGIKRILDSALQLDKKSNLHLINRAAQDTYNNVIQISTAKVDRHKILSQINNIQLNADRDINNSGSLALVDQEGQRHQNLLSETINNVISKVDRFKFSAHRKVDKAIAPILKRVTQNNYLSELGRQRAANQIIKLKNDLDYKINEDEDSHVDGDIDDYFDLIYRVLKRIYVKELHNVVKSARLQIKKMSALSLDNKNRAIKAVNYIDRQTVQNIDQLNNNQLIAEIIEGSRHSIEKVIYQISDLDPVKHTAHSLINSIAHNLSEQIRNNHDLKTKGKQKILKRILTISDRTNVAINQNDDVYINQIVHKSHQKFARIALKNNQNASINRINQVTQNAKHQIDQMNNLASVERRKAYAKINRSYHETIHNLNQAKDTAEATRAEQKGERKVNAIYDQIVGSNSFKQAAYDAITKKADDASQQIKNFDNLNGSDKKTGRQLLSRIKKQTVQDINNAYGVHDVYVAENKGTALIRQVIDKISSADVMVSAVQSAHERISHSSLGRQQKQKIINQINAMISAGINNPDMGTSRRNHRTQPSRPVKQSTQDKGSSAKRRPTPHYRYIVHNPSHHKPASQRSQTASKVEKSAGRANKPQVNETKRHTAAYSRGYRAGLNGKDERWGGQRSAEYIKRYQEGYRSGRGKYVQAYRSGAKAGRIQGMIAKPMIKLNGLSRGYVDGYVRAYRHHKVTLPVKVYAKQPIYLHRDVYFSPDNRIRKLGRRHQSFKVTKIIRRNDGSLCYRVDGGYITANPAYVTNVLASSIPRVVKVTNPRGIYMHKSKHFDTGNILKLLSKGTRVKVADVVQDGNQQRFQLRNGFYITSDQNQVKKAWL